MGRLLKNIGFALLFLVTCLILVNIFVLLPRMHMPPSQTTSFPTEDVLPEVEHADAIVAVDTLTIIKTEAINEGGIYINPEDASLRNPFFWPQKKDRQKKRVKQVPKQPQLSMVIIGEGRRQALLDDAFVREGDMFHGYQVKRIEEHQVVLVDDLGELRIHLTTSTDKGGPEKFQPGLIER